MEEQYDKLNFEGTATKQDEGMLSKMDGWVQGHPVLAATAGAPAAGAITETAKVMEKTKNDVKDAFDKMADDASKLINGMSKTFSGK